MPKRNGPGYDIPDDNPFVGQTGMRAEIWAKGLRNPWGFCRDAGTGDLWFADVGNNTMEEINRLPAGEGGKNFGWYFVEGTFVRYEGVPDDAVPPVHAYTHDDVGPAVIGGCVYRGSSISALAGAYVFADLSGPVFAIGADDETVRLDVHVEGIGPALLSGPTASSTCSRSPPAPSASSPVERPTVPHLLSTGRRCRGRRSAVVASSHGNDFRHSVAGVEQTAEVGDVRREEAIAVVDQGCDVPIHDITRPATCKQRANLTPRASIESDNVDRCQDARQVGLPGAVAPNLGNYGSARDQADASIVHHAKHRTDVSVAAVDPDERSGVQHHRHATTRSARSLSAAAARRSSSSSNGPSSASQMSSAAASRS